MIVINLDEYNLHQKKLLQEIPRSIFVYPTDTIYGIGCSALDEKKVERIRKIKNSTQPFSIIVPSKEWIYDNCEVSLEAEEWIRKLPGPYTLILKLKNPKAVAKNVYLNDSMTLGIRIPNHWFLQVAYATKIPLVTTSANISGSDFMTSLEDLDLRIRHAVDFVFYEGKKHGMPSTIIDLAGDHIEIKKRVHKSSKGPKLEFPIKEIILK